MITLEEIDAGAYGLSSYEAIAAAALKNMLTGLPVEMAKRKLKEIVSPRVLQMPKKNEPLEFIRTDIDCEKLIQLVDEAVKVGVVGIGSDPYLEKAFVDTLLNRLCCVDGHKITRNMSENFLDYVVDCCRIVW